MANIKTNFEIDGRKYYRISRTIDGKRKYFYGKSKGDAEKKYREYVEQLAGLKQEQREYIDNASFHDRAEEYIKTALRHSQRYASSTKEKYEEAYDCHIKGSDLDKMRLRDIKPSHVQQFYNSLEISKQTMQNISKFMSAFCKWLMLNDYAQDFISAVEIPTKPDNKRSEEIVVWADREVQSIIDACTRMPEDFRAWFMPLVMIYTGLRLGEVLSLRYSDFDNDMLNIKRQYTHGEIKDPKYKSFRSIPLHKDLNVYLEKHMMWHTLEMKKNAYRTEYVFTSCTGQLYNPQNIRTALKRFYKRIGVPYKEPHTYRRTFCTRLCKAGVPIQTASELMGHKNISVTAKFYTSIEKKQKKSAINKLKW